MHVVEILLPTADPGGRAFPAPLWAWVREILVERFGGVTVFSRAPADGLWEPEEGERSRDEIVVVEVMADKLDRAWWRRFRSELERRFQQDEVVVRARESERL